MPAAVSDALVYSDAPPHAPLVVEEQGSPAAMLMRCQALHAADKVAERRKKLYTGLGIGALALTFLSMFAAGVSEVFEIFFVALGAGVLAAVMFTLRVVFGRADVDDRKLHVVSHLVEVLRPELHKKRPVKMWVDFRGYERAKPQQDTTGFLRSSGSKVFVKRWLRMTFVLLDGTQVALQARSTCKRKQKAKRKYTKIKDTVTDELEVFVRPPSNVALDPSATARVQGALRPPRGPMPVARGVKIKPRVLQASFRWGPGRRLRGRGGWSSTGLERLLDGDAALAAVVATCRATRLAQGR